MGYQKISSVLTILISTIKDIIWKGKKYDLMTNLPWTGYPYKLSKETATPICQEVVQNSFATWREL